MEVPCAYIIRSNGELAYSRVLTDKETNPSLSLPSSVTAGVILLSSSASVSKKRVYFMKDGENLWAYALFNEFAVLALARETTAKTHLKQRLVSLGRAIRKSYGTTISTWDGEIPQMEELDHLVDRYLLIEPRRLSDELIDCIKEAVDEALEEYEVAYVGVFDAEGKMVCGNVPESHAQKIKEKVTGTAFKPNPDMVPSSFKVHQYDVQFFKGESLSVVAAPYVGRSKMQAVHAVDEIMQILNSIC